MSERWRRYLRFWGPNVDGDIDDEVLYHLDLHDLRDPLSLFVVEEVAGLYLHVPSHVPDHDPFRVHVRDIDRWGLDARSDRFV